MLPPLGTSFPLRRSFFVRLDVGEAGLLRGNVSCGAGAGRHHYPRLKGLWPSDMVSSLQNVAHRTAGWVGFPTETNGAARRWVAGDPTKLSPAFWRVPEHPQLWANRFRCLEVAAARLPWRARGGNSRHRSARSSRIRGEEYAGFDPPASALISVSSFAWPHMSLEVQTEAMLPR